MRHLFPSFIALPGILLVSYLPANAAASGQKYYIMIRASGSLLPSLALRRSGAALMIQYLWNPFEIFDFSNE